MTRCLTLLLLASALTFAQTGEKRVVPIEPAQLQTFDRQRKIGVAILVGVAKYPRYSGLSELRYPGRDVDLIEQELVRQRYTVLSLKDGEATRGAVLNAIRQAGEVVDPKDGSIVFFFSGHGFADRNTNYLATFDATADNLAQSGLSLPAVEKELLASGAPRRVMWIDACRNEPGKGAGESRSFARPERLAGSAGTRILFSTKAGRISYEDDELRQGLFSYYLVRGLQGEAARDDGLVSFRDLSDFVTDGVQTRSLKQGRVQVPYEAGEASGDFLLARASAKPPVMPQPAALRTEPTKVNPKDGLTYVWIEPGTFDMGCSPGDTECDKNEAKPPELTPISKGFWIGQTDVTQETYQRVTGKNPGHFKGPKLPVETVNWTEAQSYCQAAGMRLPSEAEWEYAARAGTKGARYGAIDNVAWYEKNSGNKTHEAGQKEPNAWGLYDMLGNVWQWTADSYNGGAAKTLRGGSWGGDPASVRASYRGRDVPESRYGYVGFRCVGN